MTFTLFLTVMVLVYLGVHLYLGLRLVTALELEGTAPLLLGGGLSILVAFAFPVTRLLARIAPAAGVRIVDRVVSMWLGAALYLVLMTLATHLAGLVLGWLGLWPLLERSCPVSPGIAGLALVAASTAGIIASGLASASHVTRTTEVTIPVRGLDSSLEGLTLVQLSDLHLGMIVGVGRLERIVERVRELNADLVVITGDLVDEDASGLDWMIEPLRRLRSRHGVLAVTGNHEFYTGVSQVERLAAAASIRFLRNEGVTVADGLVVYGMDDPQAAFWGGSRVALEDVVGPKARGSAAILLHHQPIGFERATSMGVDLMLSGHTHAGQLWPIPWISRLLYPWKHGHHVLGTSHMYVSAGVGTWGPPMRVGAPPEIVRITLVRAPD